MRYELGPCPTVAVAAWAVPVGATKFAIDRLLIDTRMRYEGLCLAFAVINTCSHAGIATQRRRMNAVSSCLVLFPQTPSLC